MQSYLKDTAKKIVWKAVASVEWLFSSYKAHWFSPGWHVGVSLNPQII